MDLAKFWTINNRLSTEKGRWDNIERKEKYCSLCTKNLIGDEFHYLFECKILKDIRQLNLPKYYLKHYDTFKFTQLMSSSCTDLVSLSL